MDPKEFLSNIIKDNEKNYLVWKKKKEKEKEIKKKRKKEKEPYRTLKNNFDHPNNEPLRPLV